ncbi:GcrA family cell cycle regulator [Rhizobium sp. CNPSo 4039]|uniref:GcrA family cell cycle regulator n=1 Tax=Rhizobium sp. CNPSo 4039 TaxID=3021409 RepID=UPI00330589A8
MSFWTDERILAASKMWKETRMSAAKIAAKLGCQRNAVIGIAHRKRDLFPSRQVGGDFKQSSRPWSREDLSTASMLWQQGRSDREIANIMDIKRDRVIMARRSHSHMFPARERSAPPSHDHQPQRQTSARLASLGLRASGSGAGDGGRRYQHAGQAVDPKTVTRFSSLSSRQCSWPLTNFEDDDGPDMPCCGRQRRGSPETGWTSPYCAHHAMIACARVG